MALGYHYLPSILLASAAVGLIVWQKLSVSVDADEPPLLKPTIPFVGHIIGMLKNQMMYFRILEKKNHLPAFTMPMLNGKTYILVAPGLIHSALKSKTLDFLPIELAFADRMIDMDKRAVEIVNQVEDGKFPFMEGFHKVIRGGLMPGSAKLFSLNVEVLKDIARTFNSMDGVFEAESMFLWTRNFFTMATTTALMGPHNPFIEDPSLIDNFWTWEKDLLWLMSKPIAPFIAPDAYKARLRYQKVLIEYFSKSYDLDPEVPAYSRDRADHYRKHGFNSSDIGKMEITALHGAIANTVSIMFWLLAAVFSDKALSRTIATEALAISTEEVSPEGKRVFTIDASRLTSACPNLVATFNETLRLNNQQLGTRLITADTVVSDPVTHTRYVLKAGNVVQMPSGPMHNSTEIWGANASSFDHTRFLKTSAKSDIDPEIEKLRKKAFLPFGGGKHLCPGRMFAFTEILGTCALLSVGFDMEALDGKQFKAEQGSGWLKFAEAVSKPVGKAREQGVRLRRKVGMEDVQFKFFLGENMGETVDVVAQL